ncbi:D-alanyl-D-alanine carboxypeptidase family protein [Geomonas azotofigens]|uniref:D-alanyl-D-alanine carboxypeptidase family protein n=1 Tax=Geomonas azotofigens TaxID=2843196 RepID=UPI001C105D88|nr:D-alanyl-D-alanine carboxypeptidase family protein [Geomonas azotofigens]MBU5615374.1 D-alanyl-D-alanine carboxypeptidase [Geomonas azotofigens]
MKFFQFNKLCALLAAVITALALPQPTAARSYHPATTYLVKVNGKVIRQQNAGIRRAPASLTKMMTALVVMERCNLDEVVVVSRAAARETGSRIGLRRGDKFRVRDLLAATLIASANDACRALADHACGNQTDFVVQMNARARTLGLENTHFANACGHDSKGLYSNAHDLARIAERAMQLPQFAKIVAKHDMRITTLDGRRSYYLRNKNRLIGRYPGAIGVKTGTTPNAGQCLVALAEREETRVLVVIMHSRNRWGAAPALLDAAFAASAPRHASRRTPESTVPARREDEAPPEGTVVPDQE